MTSIDPINQSLDAIRELVDMADETGAVMYFVPPPGRATICTCTWPDGYPGHPRLNPKCPAHKWVRPEQARRRAALELPAHRWEDDGGRP
jgi:hypothetical protein